jgi:hypothetical protein
VTPRCSFCSLPLVGERTAVADASMYQFYGLIEELRFIGTIRPNPRP